MLLQGSRPDEHDAIKATGHTDLPHNSAMAKILFKKTIEKFLSCSEDV